VRARGTLPGSPLIVGGELSRLSAPHAYIREGVQARIGISREFARGLEGLLAVAPERRRHPAGAPLYCGVYGVCDPAGLAELTGHRPHLPLEAMLTWAPARIDGIVGATPASPLWMQPAPRAWRLLLRSSVLAGAGRDFRYGSGSVEGAAARLLSARLEFAGRARGGLVAGGRDALPLQVRLYGGGLTGVRGVEPNRLGPKILTLTAAEVEALGCRVLPGGCEGVTVDPGQVVVRPTGGTALGELTAEARYWVIRWLQIATFVDYGAMRAGAARDAPIGISPSETILAPGVGMLVLSPLGSVRIDLGYDPSPPRRYPLLTRREGGEERIHLGSAHYDPYTFDDPPGVRELRWRIRFHLSMGQLF
jgi:hypothetical protein